MCQWVVAQSALRFGARRRECLDAGLRVHTEHILWTDLAIESTESVQNVLLERVVGVLSTCGGHPILGALLPLGEAAANGIITIVLSDSRGMIQVVDGCQESIDTLRPVLGRLEHSVHNARRVDEEFYFGCRQLRELRELWRLLEFELVSLPLEFAKLIMAISRLGVVLSLSLRLNNKLARFVHSS